MGSFGAGSPRVGAQRARQLRPNSAAEPIDPPAGAVPQGQGPGAGAPIQSLTCSGTSVLISGAGTVHDRVGIATPSSVPIQAAKGSPVVRRCKQVGRALFSRLGRSPSGSLFLSIRGA
ncbi:hypothetical protein NDU88_005968 [Pleurodeles waltl]|uniref:Uncharacterized protein n=1 Tax=Pleurodeles waltl TaxID=8319 RepID=A0AAV7UN96_PLEWA|nr:hypothetical protein NDU88_005968 [Pleurodeles waltl]